MPQEEIDRLLVEHGRAAKRVVRLKGGDPFVFGRGGEEALRLREAGIEYEIVPGITAGIAAPAYAGIPVTHRELASGVRRQSPATRTPTSQGVDARLGRARALPWHARLLHGRPRATADRRGGCRPRDGRPKNPSRWWSAARCPASARCWRRSPAASPIERGESHPKRHPSARGPHVAALREDLAWLERRPLHGLTIAVTRARAQASPLAARLRELGADVIEAPAIRTESLPAELPDPAGYDLLIATSPNGVRELLRGPHPRRPQPGRRDRGRDRYRHRTSIPGARNRGRHGARPLPWPRGWSRRSPAWKCAAP